MPLTIVDSAELYQLDLITGKSTTAQGLTLRLFSNNATIAGSTVLANLTELTLTGYSAVALTAASWSSSVTSAGKGSSSYPTLTFNFSNVSAGNVYGLYLTSNSSGLLVAAEKFATLRSVINGDSLSVTLNLTLSSES